MYCIPSTFLTSKEFRHVSQGKHVQIREVDVMIKKKLRHTFESKDDLIYCTSSLQLPQQTNITFQTEQTTITKLDRHTNYIQKH